MRAAVPESALAGVVNLAREAKGRALRCLSMTAARPSFLPFAPMRRSLISPGRPLIMHDLHIMAALLAAGMLALWSARAVSLRKVCQADVSAFRCAAVWALPAH